MKSNQNPFLNVDRSFQDYMIDVVEAAHQNGGAINLSPCQINTPDGRKIEFEIVVILRKDATDEN